MSAKENMDDIATNFLSEMSALEDEEITNDDGSGVLIHHIDGDPNHKLVIGCVGRGKSIFTTCPICNGFFIEAEGIDVEKGEVCCSDICASEFAE